ncbi:MAG: iron chelate uptake ABC transporter family permease subunit [Alistipes sp.]
MGGLTGGDCPRATVKIILNIRLVRQWCVTGRSRSIVSGLQMQTLFRNPLAGPYVLGISSGASLGGFCRTAGVGSSIGIARQHGLVQRSYWLSSPPSDIASRILW